MQDDSFLHLRGELPCQPGKGQVSFIKYGDFSQNDYACFMLTHCFTHMHPMNCDSQRVGVMIHLRWWSRFPEERTGFCLKVSDDAYVTLRCIWWQADVTVNGNVMTTGWLNHSWMLLSENRFHPRVIYKTLRDFCVNAERFELSFQNRMTIHSIVFDRFE